MNCLPATGFEGHVTLLIGLLLLLSGTAVVLVARRRTSRSAGAAVALAILVVFGMSTVSAPPAHADGCSSAPTVAPTPAPAILPDREVSFVSGGVTFYGSYRGPSDTENPVAAVVIVGGTGGIDRDSNAPGLPIDSYRWLADELSAQGIASYRYDKLGTGVTGLGPYAAEPSTMLSLTYEQLRVQPVRDALSLVAAQPGIDVSRLLLAGHSEGGALSIDVAADLGSAPDLAGLLLIEPAYTNILDIVTRQFADQIDAAVVGGAMTEDDAVTLKTWMSDGVTEIRTGTPPYAAPGPVPLPGAIDYTALMQSTIASNIYGSDPAQMVVTHAYRTLYGKGFDAVHPSALAAAITIPTLISCGTKDFNTPCGDGTPESGVRALAQAFAPGTARFVELPDTVHILRDVGDADVPQVADQIPYPYSAVLSAELSSFLAPFSE